jgi:hypothetical protein
MQSTAAGWTPCGPGVGGEIPIDREQQLLEAGVAKPRVAQ